MVAIKKMFRVAIIIINCGRAFIERIKLVLICRIKRMRLIKKTERIFTPKSKIGFHDQKEKIFCPAIKTKLVISIISGIKNQDLFKSFFMAMFLFVCRKVIKQIKIKVIIVKSI